MKTINRLSFLLIIFIFSANAAVKNTRSGTIYDKIYLAVWGAESGDTLLVARGIYTNDWIPAADISLNIKGNYSDDFSTQFQMDTVKTIVMAGLNYAAWAKNCTSYFEYIHFNAGEHGLMVDDAVVTCKNCFVEFNTNTTHGAGILAYRNSTVVLDHSLVLDNIVIGSNGKGGGAYISNDCSLVMMSNNNFIRNEAKNGAGIYVNNGTIDMNFMSSIYGNKALQNGGGIYMLNSSLTLGNKCSIGASGVNVTNIAENGNGGGIYASSSTITFTNNACLTLNYAKHGGGGVFASNCKTYFFDSSAGGGNNAGGDGGSIYCLGGEIFISNSKFTNNFAAFSGGALRLYNGVYCEINNSEFNQNIADDSDGGGIAMANSSTSILNNCVLDSNFAGDDGGGIYSIDSVLKLNKFKIINNKADMNASATHGYGGGICLFNTKAEMFSSVNLSYILTNSAENGGGIYAGNNSKVVCSPPTGGIIIDLNLIKLLFNNATENGGGICVQENSSVITTGKITFTSNSAKNGGGIYACDNSSVKMIASNSLNKPELYQNGAFVNGGGIMLSNATTFVGHKIMISENSAWNNGGGIFAIGSTSLLSATFSSPVSNPQCCLDNNLALKSGGAYIGYSGSLLDLDSVQVTNNQALGFCGGLEAYNSIIDACNTIIAGNKGTNCGGAASLFLGKVNLSFCTITDNATNAFSSGTVASGMFVLTNCIVWGNVGRTFSGPGIKYIGYSDIEGGFTGEGNIDANPILEVNYMLTAPSPCIDTGIFTDVLYDCIGNTRPYGGGVDLGAYEFVPEPCYLLFIIYNLLFIKYWRKFN